MFQFTKKDLENDKLFNVNEINKRFRKLSKIYHPDRYKKNDNNNNNNNIINSTNMSPDYATFTRLKISHRILLSMATNHNMNQFPKDWELLFDTQYQLNSWIDWKLKHNINKLAIELPKNRNCNQMTINADNYNNQDNRCILSYNLSGISIATFFGGGI